MSDPAAPTPTFAPPPAMPSIVASAWQESRLLVALTRRSLALLVTRT